MPQVAFGAPGERMGGLKERDMRCTVLGVAAVAAFFALAGCAGLQKLAEPEAPMNCRECREQLVRDSGHIELVQTVGDDTLVDNGANRFLNDGIRWLSMRCTPPTDEVRVRSSIAVGDYSFDVPGCRWLKRLWINDRDTGESTELVKSDWGTLRNEYGEVPGVVETGTPLYFCRNLRMGNQASPTPPLSQVVPAGYLPYGPWCHLIEQTPAIVYGGLYSEGDDPSLPVSFWSATELGMVCEPTVTLEEDQEAYIFGKGLLFRYARSEFLPLSLHLSYNYPTGIYLGLGTPIVLDNGDNTYTLSPGTIAMKDRNGNDVPTYTGDGLSHDVVIPLEGGAGDGFILFILGPGASVTTEMQMIVSRCEVLIDDSAFDDNFLILPPTDTAYDLESLGSVYAESLVNDDDVTWWTANHPSVVVLAARMALEVVLHRNQSGAAFFEQLLMAELDMIRRMVVYDRTNGPAGRCVMRG
jgi:hypothetical protein